MTHSHNHRISQFNLKRMNIDKSHSTIEDRTRNLTEGRGEEDLWDWDSRCGRTSEIIKFRTKWLIIFLPSERKVEWNETLWFEWMNTMIMLWMIEIQGRRTVITFSFKLLTSTSWSIKHFSHPLMVSRFWFFNV